MISKSDFRNPIGFFEDWIKELNLNTQYAHFLSTLDDNSGLLDIDKGLLISTNPETGEQESDLLTELFQDSIKNMLYEKCQESKRLIDDYYSEYQHNKGSLINYFDDKVKDKIKKITSNKALFEKFPLLSKPLEGVINHINKEYPKFALPDNLVTNSEITIPKEFDLTNNSTIEKINIVIGFLNAPSSSGTRFLSKEDYNALVDSIEKLAKGEETIFDKKIEFYNLIDNNALNYILREILYPLIKNLKFKKIHFKKFLESSVNIYENNASTFYAGTLKIPNIKKYTEEASYIEWWIGRLTS